MSDPAEKQPVIIDHTDDLLRGSLEVQVVIAKEKAERLQSVVKELGGYSIAIIAESGDPYQTIYTTDRGHRVTSSVMHVSEGEVIVGIKNTANPNTPTDLDGLLHPGED